MKTLDWQRLRETYEKTLDWQRLRETYERNPMSHTKSGKEFRVSRVSDSAVYIEIPVVVKEKVPKMAKKMTHPILGQNGRWIS